MQDPSLGLVSLVNSIRCDIKPNDIPLRRNKERSGAHFPPAPVDIADLKKHLCYAYYTPRPGAVGHRMRHFFFGSLLTGRGLRTALDKVSFDPRWRTVAPTESLRQKRSSSSAVSAPSTPDTCALGFLETPAMPVHMTRVPSASSGAPRWSFDLLSDPTWSPRV